MVKTTRAKLITLKYNELIKKVENYVDSSLFPSLEDIDISDLIFYFSQAFPNNENNDYRENLKDVIEMNNVSIKEEDFEDIYKIVEDYLLWFRSLR